MDTFSRLDTKNHGGLTKLPSQKPLYSMLYTPTLSLFNVALSLFNVAWWTRFFLEYLAVSETKGRT